MKASAVEKLIVPIEGYSALKRKLLTGELERFAQSVSCIAPCPGGRLLDLGARGDLVPVYRTMLGFDTVVCLDATADAGRKRLVHNDGTLFEYETHGVDLERDPFPYPDDHFDQVVVMEAIEHLAVDPMFTVCEANRVLKPGGGLLLTTPNITSLASLYLQLWARHPAIGRQAFGPGIMDRHHREYTPDEIRAMVHAAGFEPRRLDTFDPVEPPPSVRKMGRILKMMKWLKPDIDADHRGRVIRCACVKTSSVTERFPEVIYPRYDYYDYAAYDRKLVERFGGHRYWKTEIDVDDTPVEVL